MDTLERSAFEHKMKFQRDIILLILSVFVAVLFVLLGIVNSLVESVRGFGILGVFLAGVGFASAFFAAPASVILFAFAQHMSFLLVAVVGALGSMLGDWFIFRFFRNDISEDFRFLLEKYHPSARVRFIFSSRLFYWFASFVAALIIASPLPDEIGLAIFGALRLNTRRFLPVSFALNLLGILIITLFAQISPAA